MSVILENGSCNALSPVVHGDIVQSINSNTNSNSNWTFIGELNLPYSVVTLSPPTSEARVRFPAQPQVGKLVVVCHSLAVYSTEP